MNDQSDFDWVVLKASLGIPIKQDGVNADMPRSIL